METSTEPPCPIKVKNEIVDEEPTVPFIPQSDIVNRVKSEKPSDDEDQKLDSYCPPLKKRRPEYIKEELSREPDQNHQSNQNDSISGCDDDYLSATEKKFNPNDLILANGSLEPDKGNDRTIDDSRESIQMCPPLTIMAADQTAEEKHVVLPDISPSEDKIVQVKREPENHEENIYVQKTKVDAKRKAEKIKWFRCNSEGCPYKTRYYVIFVRHQLSHRFKNRLKCRYCSFSCKSRVMLTSHLLEHVETQNMRSAPPEADDLKRMTWLSCLVANCSFKTKNLVNFEKHSAYHQRQQLLRCRYCSMSCRGRVRMKAHLLRHHSGKNGNRKPCADEKPQIDSSSSDSDSEIDIKAMILKEEIFDVNSQKKAKPDHPHEESSQQTSQGYKDTLNVSNDTNKEATVLCIGDSKEEINEKESEVKRTITITIRHSKKSDDGSSLKTALLSGILKSFGMSDEQTNSCQKHVAEENDKEKLYGDSNQESQDIPDSGQFKKPAVVADILRLFSSPNEEEESDTLGMTPPRNTDEQEIQGESGKTGTLPEPNEHTRSQESFGENADFSIIEKPEMQPILSDNLPKTSVTDGKGYTDLSIIENSQMLSFSDSLPKNDSVKASVTGGKGHTDLSISEKPQMLSFNANLLKNDAVKASATGEKENTDLSISEKPQMLTLSNNQLKNDTVKTSATDEKGSTDLSVGEKSQMLTLNGNQTNDDTVKTSFASDKENTDISISETPQMLTLSYNHLKNGTVKTYSVEKGNTDLSISENLQMLILSDKQSNNDIVKSSVAGEKENTDLSISEAPQMLTLNYSQTKNGTVKTSASDEKENTDLSISENPQKLTLTDNQPNNDVVKTSVAGEKENTDLSISEESQVLTLSYKQPKSDTVENSVAGEKGNTDLSKSEKPQMLTLSDNQPISDTVKTSVAGEKGNANLSISEKPQMLPLSDNQPKNDAVDISVAGKKGNTDLFVSEKPQMLTSSENQPENNTVKSFATYEKENINLSITEKPQMFAVSDNQPNNNTVKNYAIEEEAYTDLCISGKPLADYQLKSYTVITSTTDAKPEELAENFKCEPPHSAIFDDNQSFCKSDKKKIANLKQVVIGRVRKESVKYSVPAENTHTLESSWIPISYEPLSEEMTCVDNECPYKTINAQDLKLHLSFHDDAGILKCPNCTYSCENVSDLKDHMNLHIERRNSRRNNVEISPLKLPAPLRRPSTDTVEDLEPLIISNPVFTCKFCPTKVNHEQLFKMHLIRHCTTAGIKCPLCTYRSSKTDLLKHLSCHVENIDGMFLCPLCTEKKRNKENLDDHVKVIHSRALFREHNATCRRNFCNGHC